MTENKTKTIYINIWNIFLSLSFLAIFFILIWASFRGFEITDEGLYMLHIENPQYYDFISRYHVLVNKLLGWIGPEIYKYRLVNRFVNIAGSFIFYFGFWSWLKTFVKNDEYNFWNKLSVFLFIAIGNLMTMFILLQSVNYYNLNNFFILGSAGFLLLHIAKTKNNEKPLFPLLLCGFFGAMGFFVKYPSMILFLFSTFIILMLEHKRLHNLLLLAGGFLTGIVLYFGLFETPQVFMEEFISLNKMNIQNQSHNPVRLILEYINSLSIMFITSFYMFVIPLIFLVMNAMLQKIDKIPSVYKKFIFVLFISLAVFSLLYEIHLMKFVMAMVILLVSIFFLITFLLLSHSQKEVQLYIKNISQGYKDLLVIILIFLMPFIMSFGSANNIIMMSFNHIAPWFAIFILLSHSEVLGSEMYKKYSKIIPVFILFFSMFCLLIFFIADPFRINGNYLKQDYSLNDTNIPKLKNLHVTEQTYYFVHNLKELFNKSGFKKGDYLYGFAICGIVYAFDGISPGKIAMYGPETMLGEMPNIYGYTNALKSGNLHKSYFLLPENCREKICRKIKSEEFFKDYEVVGKIYNPYPSIDRNYPATPLILYKPPELERK